MSWIQGYFGYYTIGFYLTNHNANSLICVLLFGGLKIPRVKEKSIYLPFFFL
jgi:hypothetical protein